MKRKDSVSNGKGKERASKTGRANDSGTRKVIKRKGKAKPRNSGVSILPDDPDPHSLVNSHVIFLGMWWVGTNFTEIEKRLKSLLGIVEPGNLILFIISIMQMVDTAFSTIY